MAVSLYRPSAQAASAQQTAANTPRSPGFATVRTEDADEYAGALAHWNMSNCQLSLGKFSGRVDRLELPKLNIFRKRTNQTLLETGHGPSGAFSLAIPLFQTGATYHSGSTLGPGQAAFLNDGAKLTFRSPEQLDLLAVTLDHQVMLETLQLLDRTLAEHFERLEADTLVVENDTCAILAQWLLDALSHSDRRAALLASPALQTDLLERVCLLAARMLCRDGHPDRAHRVRNGRQQLVERATQFLERSWFEPMRITDICRELNADRRTLQNAFQEVLGLSPNAFFKNVRLNRAHQELKRFSQTEEPICEIATRWGFWHLSQFAHDYHRAFGELPSETRRRARIRVG